MKKILKIFLILIFSLQLKSQSFTNMKILDYEYLNLIFDTVENFKPKVVFADESPILLFNKGLPASDVKLNAGEIANLLCFSSEKYDYEYKSVKYNLHYLKINQNGSFYWTYSIFPYIFDDNHPDAFIIIDGTKYNIYSAKCIKHITDGVYKGYEIIILKNTKTEKYSLIQCNKYPDALTGHLYGSKFAYLQNDDEVSEKITGISAEKNIINLAITVKYKNGGAKYIISFDFTNEHPEAKYWSVFIENK